MARNIYISIEYAKSFDTIEHKTLEAILLTRKSLLFNKDEIWVKKDNSSFNVTMRSFDIAKIYDIVGLYLLNKLSNLLGNENVELYRDDGLAAINSCSGPVLDRPRKSIIVLFKKEGLNITIETNLVETDFLDVTFNIFPISQTNQRSSIHQCQIKPSSNNHKRPPKKDQ